MGKYLFSTVFTVAAGAALSLLFSLSAVAATDGALGATSSASSTVSLTIPELVRVSGVKDMNLGAFSGSSLSANTDLCVYSNATGGYQVRISDNNAQAGFALASEDSDSIVPISVAWNNTAGTSGAQIVGRGAAVVATGADTKQADCATNGANANISIDVNKAAMMAAAPGSYAAILTVMVEPG